MATGRVDGLFCVELCKLWLEVGGSESLTVQVVSKGFFCDFCLPGSFVPISKRVGGEVAAG